MKTQLEKARALNDLGHQMGSQDRRSGLGQVCRPAMEPLAVEIDPHLRGEETGIVRVAKQRGWGTSTSMTWATTTGA